MRSSFLSTKALDRTSMAVLLVMLFALFFRTLFLDQNEFRFDIFGYYLYLPAMFVHGDPLLNDVTWVREALVKYDASGSLYQISSAPDGSPIYFFLMGQAILYLPFFLLAHAIALLTGYTADGFSQPYQVVLAYGMLVYVFGGLLVLKKILTRWFTDRERAWVILLIGLGTNYLHFMSAKDLETASTLFFMMTLLVWNTIRWHER